MFNKEFVVFSSKLFPSEHTARRTVASHFLYFSVGNYLRLRLFVKTFLRRTSTLGYQQNIKIVPHCCFCGKPNEIVDCQLR
jgi:hypothetical protein